MRYEIKGGSFPVVICNLENSEKMVTEKGSIGIVIADKLRDGSIDFGAAKAMANSYAVEAMPQKNI